MLWSVYILYNSLFETKNAYFVGIKSVLLLKNSVIAPFTEKATLSSLELYTSKREDIEFGMGLLETISATFADNIIGIQP